MKPLIVHLTPGYFSEKSMIGGGERYVFNLQDAVQSCGRFDQRIVSIGEDAHAFEHNNCPVKILKNESPHDGAMEHISSALWSEITNADIVHIHQILTTFGAYATAIASSLKKKIVGTDHGGGQIPFMLNGGGLNLLSAILSVSEYSKSLTKNYFHGLHEVVIGPLDTDNFSPSKNSAEVSRSVICVGRILPHKGYERVILASPNDLRLTIVGRVYDDEYYKFLKRCAAKKNVHFINDADDRDLIGIYRGAGLFVQATRTVSMNGDIINKPELMGLTTLEAMSCGLPALVSDAGSLPELATDERFSRVFRNEGELTKMLQEFRDGVWPIGDSRGLAHQHVVEHHGKRAVGEKVSALYSAIM